MTVGEISAEDRETHQIPKDVTGLLITKVEPASEAADKGLAPGDVIVEINQQPVTAPDEAAEILGSAGKAGRSSVLLLVNRQGDVRFVALKLKKK